MEDEGLRAMAGCSSLRLCIILPERVTHVEKSFPLVRLTIDVGVPVVATVTLQSFEALQLSVGAKACVSFKAVALQVF